MRALTPAGLAHGRRSLRLLCLAVRTSRPQPRREPRYRFRSHISVSRRVRGPRLRRHPASSPHHAAETGSLTYRLLVRLRLLSTPPHGDAVTFGYTGCDLLWTGLPPAGQRNITDALGGRLRGHDETFEEYALGNGAGKWSTYCSERP